MDLELKTALDAHAKAWEAFKATNEQRLAALESRLDSLFLSADSSSQIPPATDSN